MTKLTLKEAEKIFPGGKKAIDAISLEVREGDFVVLVGRSGSGKSTLLRMIAGLEEFTGGELSIDGKPVTQTPAKERSVSLMTQSNAPNANLTVYDNLAQGLKLRKVAPALIDVRVKAAAELFGLTADLQKKPKTLTAFARRRIALGRIVAREPKVMLFDEPFSNLDGELRRTMLSELVKLHARLRGTFLYATDNICEAMTLATHIVVMRDGKIEQQGTPLEVYETPKTRYVADLIASANLFDGAKLVHEGGTIRAKVCKLSLPLPRSIADRIQNPDAYCTGKAVCLAVRPEDVSLGGEIPAKVERANGNSAECELNPHSEWLPDRIRITARIEDVAVGDEIALSFDLEHVLLFDGETGESILS